jgi:Hepatocellular carcinoma-associated antigen 59
MLLFIPCPIHYCRQEFVDKELRRRRGEDVDGEIVETKTAGQVQDDAEAELYQTPEFVRSFKAQASDDSVTARVMAGITEVALPISVKLKNIEATEEAKRKLLKVWQSGGSSQQSSATDITGPMPASFSANYNKHQKQWISKVRAREDNTDGTTGSGATSGTMSNRSHRQHHGPAPPTALASSDDVAVKRFINREQRKWKRRR